MMIAALLDLLEIYSSLQFTTSIYGLNLRSCLSSVTQPATEVLIGNSDQHNASQETLRGHAILVLRRLPWLRWTCHVCLRSIPLA
jgi:hypothetical protein